MSSPHGSKSLELTRYLANKFLSDGQRKAVKNFLARLQRLPLKALGIESLIDGQKAEIERLKSRLAIVDGKFNLALYGMPGVGELKATLLSNSLLPKLDPRVELGVALAPARSRVRYEFTEVLGRVSAGKCVIFGVFPGLGGWLGGIGGLTHASVVEPDSSRGPVGAVSSSVTLEVLPTSFLNALIACADGGCELLVCAHRYPQLSPLEQVQFLELACRKLAPSGVLCIEAPDLTAGQAAGDLYWAEPQTLRPYSASLIQDVLAARPGTLSVRTAGESRVFVFRKGS